MHDPIVRFESFPFYDELKKGLVSTYMSKRVEVLTLKQKKVLSIDQRHAAKVDMGARWQASCHLPGRILPPSFCWNQGGMI